VAVSPCVPAQAAESEFVGVLTLAVENDVAEQLKLTAAQKQKLLELIDARENEALELALELKDLSPAERAERLAPFRRQSESRGLAILDPPQRVRLEQIRLQRAGLAALVDLEVAEKLKLTDSQKTQLAAIRAKRTKELAGPGSSAHTVRAAAEREMAAVLTPEQQAQWESLTAGEVIDPENPFAVAEAQARLAARAAGRKIAAPDKTSATPGLEKTAMSAAASPAETPDKPAEPVAAKEPRLRFNFRFQPWKDVLDWFAQQADLSLVLEAPPPGTFNYSDTREYTPAEAIDLLNSVLLTKGYTLVRHDRMLMLVNLEDGIPPNLVSTVSEEALDQRGEYELVRVLFSLNKLTAEEAEAEIKKLLGPQGSVVPLAKSRQVLVTETAGRLRAIRSVIRRSEEPQGLTGSQIRSYELKHALPSDIMAVVRQLLDIPEDKNASADGSIRFALDPLGGRLLVSGDAEMLARVDEILKVVDVAGPGGGEPGVQETPQLEVYSITTADSLAVLAVMQTLMAGQPDVRLAIDEKTGNLVALARPSQHATIRATLDQMQRDARTVEVIRLRIVDPQLAVLSINKLFGGGTEGANKNAPKVDADPSTRQLLVRGTQSQVEQIRSLLEKMGETQQDETAAQDRRNVRMLPLSGQAAHSALQRIQEIWPTMHKNQIRVVSPSSAIPVARPGSSAQPGSRTGIAFPAMPLLPEIAPSESVPETDQEIRPTMPPATEEATPEKMPAADESTPEKPPVPRESLPEKPPVPQATPPEAAPPETTPPDAAPRKADPDEEKSTRRLHGARVFFVSQNGGEPEHEEKDSAPPAEPPATALQAPPAAEKPKSSEPAPIIVTVGPGGVMIASEDIEALDDFEELLTTLAGSAMAGSPEMTIFYLKHAKATVVAETLDTIFGGGTLAKSASPEGGSLLGDLAGAAMGDSGGGILGTLLGMGGDKSIAPSGTIKITPDSRLNALVVQANPTDLNTIEQLLKILDQKESPEEILVAPKARVIHVVNTQASEIADILKQVYQDRMVAGGPGGGAQPPTPQEFIQMLRGGRRGGGGAGSSRTSAEDIQKMSLSIDERTNSLIVAAPEQLFQEVKLLVEELDAAAVKSGQTTRVVTLHKANAEAVGQALSSMLGDSVQFGKTSTTAKPRTPSPTAAPASSRSTGRSSGRSTTRSTTPVPAPAPSVQPPTTYRFPTNFRPPRTR